MGHKFRYNNTTYSLFSSTSRITTPSLCHRENGTTYYVPLLTSRSQTIGDYVYNASSPTRCCRYNNTTYYAAKSRTLAYDIPAGTYGARDFGILLSEFIDDSRTCKDSFTITAYYPTGRVSASSVIPGNSVIKYVESYSGKRQGFTFNGGNMNSVSWASGKAGYITYDTYDVDPFRQWKQSYVYVTGIKFN